ncbi:MAG: hypothetical protein Q4D68_04475 [Moraxella equi]|nr:hypothetical protein [Moraxella equi]
MINFQKVTDLVKAYGAVDFDSEPDDSILWFRGINCYLIIVSVKQDRTFATVWEDDECNEVIENFEIYTENELNACLEKYALISDEKAKEIQNKEQVDTTMIDIYIKIIKEKLAEQQISLDFESQTKAERLVVRHIENKLAEIIQFLQ